MYDLDSAVLVGHLPHPLFPTKVCRKHADDRLCDVHLSQGGTLLDARKLCNMQSRAANEKVLEAGR
jgi:hypothetical protein